MFTEFEILGFIAGICTTGAFIPQIIQVLKTKSANDFSYGWLGLTIIGLFLWLLYGVFIDSTPVVFFNFLTIMFLFTILYFKISGNKIKAPHA